MYLPASFSESDPSVIAEFVSMNPLGILVSQSDAGLITTPVPFQFDGTTLVTHVSRANKHWEALQQKPECIVVFQGANAYVTPEWYETKQETGMVVPTWNYEIVQFTGKATIHDDPEWIRNQVGDITDHMEQVREQAWAVSDAPEEFVNKQLRAIVGIEITVKETIGKWKMSQNRNAADAHGVVTGMANPADPHHNEEVSRIVTKRLGKP